MDKDNRQDLKINTLEVNFKTMFEQNNKDHKDLKGGIDLLSEKMDNLIDNMETKFASKWVEKVIIAVVIALIVGSIKVFS